MTMIRKFMLAAAPLALLALGGCATGFRADVARFQAMPAPQGETFAVVPQDPALEGGLEFASYARIVSDQLVAKGYQPAPAAQASMLVKLDYGVDRGREKIRTTPGGFGYGGFGDPFYGRGGFGYGGFGYGRRGYMLGFHDPFMWGGYGGGSVDSYTVYTSDLDMVIERKADGQRLFEGSAKAVSGTDKLTYLVPNLIEAMFTGFPGHSGETVKITVPPPPRG